MKKLLQNLINNQTGSMFVYLFFLSTTLLVFTFILFHQYQNEQKIGTLELEHMQLNMIHQQAYQTIISDWGEINCNETIELSFPNGKASVNIAKYHQDYYTVTIRAYSNPPHQNIRQYFVRKE